MNFFDDCDAPPIKNPSIPRTDEKFLIFFSFTEPPYKTAGVFLVLKIFLN